MWKFAESFASYPNAFVGVVDNIESLSLFSILDIFANVSFSAAYFLITQDLLPYP